MPCKLSFIFAENLICGIAIKIGDTPNDTQELYFLHL